MPILTPEERVGKVVAERYRIDSILGAGGMGVVFSGVHTWTGRPVAIKILAPEFVRNEQVVQRFLQEARTAARLRHPNVVDVLDMGEDTDGTVFLVLELLEGESLCDLMEREGPLRPERALELLLPVMHALISAHRRNIIHRDIKPDNIFISHDEGRKVVPKLLDFGIAKVLEESQTGTITGTVIGTPYYMSPEQAAGTGEVGPQSDIWSMGVVLYEALTSSLPFTGVSPTQVLLAIAVGKPVQLAERAPSLPRVFAAAIDQAMIPDRRERYASMRDFINSLLSAAMEAGIAVNPAATLRSVLPPPMNPSPRPVMRADPESATMDLQTGPKLIPIESEAPIALPRGGVAMVVERARRAGWRLLVAATIGITLVGIALAAVLSDAGEARSESRSPDRIASPPHDPDRTPSDRGAPAAQPVALPEPAAPSSARAVRPLPEGVAAPAAEHVVESQQGTTGVGVSRPAVQRAGSTAPSTPSTPIGRPREGAVPPPTKRPESARPVERARPELLREW